ncbi:hypothetical protein AWC38_SpisGene12715 [Stylophora pistillata]|uniref:Uncharacterized protein n=1 Tax=Stylophora pistillata TaxID=50429 RepID=A0A2B4S2D8_STYPI|nr:hypothetical protein AWC38_SpisGene12715 [Stylophora pistillata]
MKRYYYGLIGTLLALVTSCVPLVILVAASFCGKEKASALIHWIVSNAFSAVITKKTDSGLTRWYLKDIELTRSERLMRKLFSSLFGLFFTMFTLASSVFWETLLLDVSYGCKPDDASMSMECFEYNIKENVEFWRAFSRFGEYPIDCNSPKYLNGSVGVICYQMVFNIGAASGASYGGFKLAMIAVNAATSAMLLHKRSGTVNRTRIFIAVLLVTVYVAFVVSQVVETEKGPSSLIVMIDSHNVAIYLQVIMGLGAILSFVYYIPWKQLVAFQSLTVFISV